MFFAGETNPTKYLLALKYLEAIRSVVGMPGPSIKYVPSTLTDGMKGGAMPAALSVGMLLGQSFAAP